MVKSKHVLRFFRNERNFFTNEAINFYLALSALLSWTYEVSLRPENETIEKQSGQKMYYSGIWIKIKVFFRQYFDEEKKKCSCRLNPEKLSDLSW